MRDEKTNVEILRRGHINFQKCIYIEKPILAHEVFTRIITRLLQ